MQKSNREEEKYKEDGIGKAVLVQRRSGLRLGPSEDGKLNLPCGLGPVRVVMMQNFATAEPLRKQTLLNAGRAAAQAGRSYRHGKVPR
jgi:hypothetical protein